MSTETNEIVVQNTPLFEIIEQAYWQAGNCYYKQTSKVRSIRKLTKEDIDWMHKFVMQGQGYRVIAASEEPVGKYVKYDAKGRPSWRDFYEYTIECCVDSGD